MQRCACGSWRVNGRATASYTTVSDLAAIERLDALAETTSNTVVNERLLQRLLESRVQVQHTALSGSDNGSRLSLYFILFVGHFNLEVPVRLVL